MNTKTEGTFAIVAALIVLAPIVSIVVSIAALLGYGIFKLSQKNS